MNKESAAIVEAICTLLQQVGALVRVTRQVFLLSNMGTHFVFAGEKTSAPPADDVLVITAAPVALCYKEPEYIIWYDGALVKFDEFTTRVLSDLGIEVRARKESDGGAMVFRNGRLEWAGPSRHLETPPASRVDQASDQGA